MITVYGASDDLIEVDGTILRITYMPSGVWRIGVVTRGSAELKVEPAPEGDEDNYSDRATLDGAVWVVHGIDHATATP